MKCKVAVFLCLLALVMTIASEVTARDLAETETAKAASETHGLEESLYHGGGGGGHGHYCHRYCCPGYYYGGYCQRYCCHGKAESEPQN